MRPRTCPPPLNSNWYFGPNIEFYSTKYTPHFHLVIMTIFGLHSTVIHQVNNDRIKCVFKHALIILLGCQRPCAHDFVLMLIFCRKTPPISPSFYSATTLSPFNPFSSTQKIPKCHLLHLQKQCQRQSILLHVPLLTASTTST